MINGHGRLKIIEKSTKGNTDRTNHSKRADKGKIDISYKKCKFCNSKKIFNFENGRTKCCKCGKSQK